LIWIEVPGNMRASSAKQSAPTMQTSPVLAQITRAMPRYIYTNSFLNIFK
jgi:hypothetical protein